MQKILHTFHIQWSIYMCRGGSRILVRGSQMSFDPNGLALSPRFAQNRGFPLKLPENCMILEKMLGARWGPPPPLRKWCTLVKTTELNMSWSVFVNTTSTTDSLSTKRNYRNGTQPKKNNQSYVCNLLHPRMQFGTPPKNYPQSLAVLFEGLRSEPGVALAG